MIWNAIRQIRFFSTAPTKPLFVTTPIFYVNAAPHIGHLYSAVIADAAFRFEQLLGHHPGYIFTTGTDEHGSKIQNSAALHNTTPSHYCDRISQEYRSLFGKASVDYTDFIRTTEHRHQMAVTAFWNSLKRNDSIYTTQYAGWYCVADESFLTEVQLKEQGGQKVSIESGHPVEWTREENYMFRLSKFQEDIIYWIKSGERIKPKKFEKILMDTLSEPLPDVSISRPSSRVHWGISVPDDPSQTVYVWLDALVNYLTCAGYPDDGFKSKWPPTMHVIGKDIMKFHGIYWPAFLIAAGLEPPHSMLVHSHWTVDGEKMSKSKFNVIDPMERAETYTHDGMRYFLLREGTAHSDANYSDTKVMRILNSELADTLGNLLSRGCAKTVNVQQVFPALDTDYFHDDLMQLDVTKKLVALVSQLPEKCHNHYKVHNFYLAVDLVLEALHVANNFFETTKPWELRKNNETQRLHAVLATTLETLRVCGIILQPIIPVLSRKLLDKLCVPTAQRTWADLYYVAWQKKCTTTDESRRHGAERALSTEHDAILFRRIRMDVEKKQTKHA